MKRLVVFLLLLSSFALSIAKDAIPDAPNPPRLVNDFVGVFSSQQKETMENRLVAFNDSTSNVICVVIVDDLGEYTAAEFAYEIGDRWGVQNQSDNNGLVILIKTRNNTGGDIFIATGYALEGALPDAYVKRIINNNMIPLLKEERYYDAVTAALDEMMPVIAGEISAPRDQQSGDQSDDAASVISFVIFLFIGVLIFLACSKSAKEEKVNAIISNAVRTNQHLGDGKEQLFGQLKKYKVSRNIFEAKLKDEVLKQLIAPTLEDGVVTSEERRYIFQQAVAMGYSHTSVEQKLQQMIDKEAEKIIDEELELCRGNVNEQQLLQKLLILGISAAVFAALLKKRTAAYHARHLSDNHYGDGFGGFGGGSFGGGGNFGGGGFGGFGSHGGFGGGGAGGRF